MAAELKVVELSRIKRACSECNMYSLCLPLGLHSDDLGTLEQIIKRSSPIAKGKHLFTPGQTFTSIFAVRTGSVKSYIITPDGKEQIIGFHLPGEILGLDAISDEKYPCFASAMETTTVCEIPFEQLESLTCEVKGLQHQMLRVMSKELNADEQLMMVLGKKTAEARLATLLMTLSRRYKERGYSATQFNLPMSRNDIANYLGLAVETVSRLFTRFQEEGILNVQRKLIHITNMTSLSEIAGLEPVSSTCHK